MRFKKGKIEGVLKQSVDYVHNITLKTGGFHISLQHVTIKVIYEIINKEGAMKTGVPEFFACQQDRYVVYPIPDKSYYCEIIAAISIKL